MIFRNLLTGILIFFIVTVSYAQGGMWLPHEIADREADMQSLGMKMTAEEIYATNQSSLKDAVVHFSNFCTSSIISPNGLLLTNHHCGYGAIQELSSVENNYLENGFYASTHEEELPAENMFAKFVVRIDDVTNMVLKDVTVEMSEEERGEAVEEAIRTLKSRYTLKEHESIEIKPFYYGNQYIMYQYRTYPDVRLVYAPPSSIGKFGADTDNWVWPRHTGDFALFRIYASPDNKPARYSTENRPYDPKSYIPVSLKGVEEGDFTMIFGFPGSTAEYLPSFAITQHIEQINPVRIKIRDRSLEVLDEEMRSSEEAKLKYASRFASLANSWKKWIGESQGLEFTNAVQKRADYEAEFIRRVESNPEWKNTYAHLLPEFKNIYEDADPYERQAALHGEVFGRNISLMNTVNIISRLVATYELHDEEGFRSLAPRYRDYLISTFEDFDPELDQRIFLSVIDEYQNQTDPEMMSQENEKLLEKYNDTDEVKELYEESIFADSEDFSTVMEKDPEEAIEDITSDPAYKFYIAFADEFDRTVRPVLDSLGAKRKPLMRVYMEAQMRVMPEKEFFPDANSTMRITYGQVNGYSPRDAVYYLPVTYLGGVVEKHVDNDYEFDAPDKLLNLYAMENYGPYADTTGDVPVCFIATNHTTGGNSGSPALNADGELVGINFDRAWEGTMSDFYYDPEICRNIMTDSRYIMFILDKFSGAERLVKEILEPQKIKRDRPVKLEKRRKADVPRE